MNSNRVTKEDILAQIGEVRYEVHGKLTLAFVTMANGFQDIGKSACVDPANFDKALGEEYALEDFITNIWPKMGYALQDRNYRAAANQAAPAPGARPAHQQRVIDEQAELLDRLTKLGEFRRTSPKFVELDGAEQRRLGRQYDAMYEYSTVLSERINAF